MFLDVFELCRTIKLGPPKSINIIHRIFQKENKIRLLSPLEKDNWLGVWSIFYFPFHIWDVILPIDELIFFKMGTLHHQPDKIGLLGPSF